MKPGLLQPTLVRVSDDAATTIRELTRAVKVVHRVYGPWPSFQAEEVPAGHGAQVAQEGLVVVGGRDEGGAVGDPHDQGGEHGVGGAPHRRLWIGVVDVVAGVHQRRGDKVAEFAAVVRAAAPDLGVAAETSMTGRRNAAWRKKMAATWRTTWSASWSAATLCRRPGSARAAWSARTQATPCS